LGLFVDWLEDDYQSAVLCGVTDAARQQDANVLCFAGGWLDSPGRFGSRRNRTFSLANTKNVDALIVIAGCLGNHIGPEGVSDFLRRFGEMPKVSIAVPLHGMPGVLVDNARGMRDAIEHLIVQHGYRRIAFIRGPEANEEAERRFRVYREVLNAHGLPYDPALVTIGDFHRHSGLVAVHHLLGLGRQRIDAIVAASDYMALGVMDGLEAVGYRVPMDVAVIGFDDVDEARFASPPLTTVRQPLYEQGLQAANIACAMLRGVHVEGHVTLHTELVLRRSCGCFSQSPAVSIPAPAGPTAPVLGQAVARRRERILAEMNQAMRGLAQFLSPDWHVRLLDEFMNEIEGRKGTGFLAALEDCLRQVTQKGSDGSVWQDVISALRRQLLPCFSELSDKARAEELWQQGRLLVASVVERVQAQQRLEAERWVRILSETNERVITTFDVVELASALADQLPRLGIQSCYLALYDNSGDDDQAKLILAHDNRRKLTADWVGQCFDAHQLLPDGLILAEARATHIVEPLFFQDHALGFVILEMGPRQGVIYEALRDQLSAALKGALLVQEVVDKDREREALLQTIERRARELEEAYTALKQNQEMLLSAEKMASIGRLTASIAHEMNSPVAAIRAALVELERRVQEYADSANDTEVTLDDHREIVGEMQQALRLATGAAARAADFVSSIKNQTRDTGKKERIVFDAVANIRETLLLLGHSLRKGNCRIDLRTSGESIKLHGAPGRLGQIVTNLVTNSIDAMSPKGGVIVLDIAEESERVVMRVADTGPGIPVDLLDKIWEPLFTTKPFGHGTGLGLTIVREIVTADFGGSVEVMPCDAGGVTFLVTIPIRDEEVSV
jgi:DNA-binding LacI/PurR family transcriptional regulator/C4-dicarboxylate-specific signal transduction histidine kinase